MNKLLSLVCLVPCFVHAETITVATFNAEFLYTSKVHVKYGHRFRMSENTPTEQTQWAQPIFRTQKFDQAVDALGLNNAQFRILQETIASGIDSSGKVVTFLR